MNKKLQISASTLGLLAVAAMPVTMQMNTTANTTMPSTTTSAVISVTKTQPGTTPTVTTSANTAVGVAPTTVTGQITSTQVATDADLNAYTAAALSSDSTANAGISATDDAVIKTVAYQDNGVTADFSQPVKFLGLFPTSIDATATVTADGTTMVTYPWYSFLVRKHATAINDIFQAQVTDATAGKAQLSANASATMPDSTKAMVLDALRQAIHGLRSKAAVSASATTSASTQ
jgi:hypothetical protein